MNSFKTFLNRFDANLTGFRAVDTDQSAAFRDAICSNAVCQTREIKGTIFVPTFQADKVAAELVRGAWVRN